MPAKTCVLQCTILLLLCTFCLYASAQTSASAVLAQLSQAMSGGKAMNSMELAGNATWYAGSLTDTGTATASFDAKGGMKLTLSLAKRGLHTESVVPADALSTCAWANADSVSHPLGSWTCWRPINWLYPAISLQPSLLLNGVGVADLGTGEVGSGTFRHLQAQLVLSALPTEQVTNLMKDSTSDIGLDPSSSLPQVLTYNVHPDSGTPTLIPIEIRYSQYQVVNGVQVPFRIDKYINGSLQLSIAITNAKSN